MIRLKRAYEPASTDDGVRYLVERLWPRGLKNGSQDRWMAERRRPECRTPALEANRVGFAPILKAARRGAVTLIYSSQDAENNAAVALRDYLEATGHRKARRKG